MKLRMSKFAVLMAVVCLVSGLAIVRADCFVYERPGVAMGAINDDGGDEDFEFTGTVQKLPATGLVGDWMVGGTTVHVTTATKIDQEDGPIAVGTVVQVQGTKRADGSVDAQEIEVQDEGQQNQVHFKGTITALPNTTGFIGDWTVGGKTIHVTSATRIDQEEGPVVLGAFISVEGTQRPDGSIDASKIEILSNPAGDDGHAELEGTVQSLPNTPGFIGDWMVSGRIVHVTTATVIDQEEGQVAVGAQVEVKGNLETNNSIDATKIEVKGQQDEQQEVGMKGSIQSLPHDSDMTGDWVVNTTTVHVTTSTRLVNPHGIFTVGGHVKVKGTMRSDGSIDAMRIKSRD